MTNLAELKRITRELAEEVAYEERGPIFKLVTLVLDKIKSYAAIIGNNHKLIWVNQTAAKQANTHHIDIRSLYGINCKTLNLCSGECGDCPVTKSLKTKEVVTSEFKCVKSNDIYNMVCIPLVHNGTSGVIVIMGLKT